MEEEKIIELEDIEIFQKLSKLSSKTYKKIKRRKNRPRILKDSVISGPVPSGLPFV